MAITPLARFLLPPACVVCRAPCDPAMPVCPGCVGELNHASAIRESPPPGITRVDSCAPHEGVARDLLVALKFGRMVGLVPLITGYMLDLLGPVAPGHAMTPVPAARIRMRWRGFDPALELAREMSRVEPGFDLREGFLLRRGSDRQRGRNRAARVGNPPRIVPARPSPAGGGNASGRPDPAGSRGPVILVDDVMTTGATLAACAAALADAGAGPVSAVTFTRRL